MKKKRCGRESEKEITIDKKIMRPYKQLPNTEYIQIEQMGISIKLDFDLSDKINLLLSMSKIQEILKTYTYNANKPTFSAHPLTVYDA